MNQALDRFVIVEADAQLNFAVGEAEVREAAGRGFLLLIFLRMHQCIRNTKRVRVVIGRIEPHQQSGWGQKQQ
jgi:hypothetical protein